MMAFCYSNEESATCLHDRICYCNLESFFKFIQQSEKTLMNSKEELKNLSSSSLLIDFFLQLEITILKFLKRAVQMFAECSSAPPQISPDKSFLSKHIISIHSTSQNLTASYSVSAPDPYLTDSHLTVRHILL